MFHISRILASKTQQLQITKPVLEEEIKRFLERKFSETSPPFFLKNNTLFLVLHNPARSGNLFFIKNELLRELNNALSSSKIKEIRIIG